MKKVIIGLAVLVLAGLAHAVNTTNYVPDGQFESPNGDVGPWQNMFGGDTISFLPTGGNPDGCVQISDAGSYGGIAYVNPPAGNQPTLASLGLTAGQTYTFVMDMQIVSGTSIGGLKIESWNDSAVLGTSGDMRPLSGTTDWATYTFSYTISRGATHLNIVPLWGANSTINYDNIGVVVPGPTAATVAITSPTNTQVVFSPFTINATATVNPGTVTNVGFYVDNVFAGRATNSPFALIASGVSPGAHTLKAVALDSNGNAATSSVVNITVTNVAAPAFSAYESFNYPQGDLVNGTPSTGTGFAGNWSCGVNGSIVSGLSYPNLSAANNALQSSSTFQLESLSTVPSGIGTIWVSFIFNQAGDNGGNRDGFVMEDSTGKGVMFAYQQFQATFGEPGITTVNGFTAVGSQLGNSTVTQTYNANNFYVVKLSYSGGALNGVSVYSNPTAGPGQANPPAPDFSVSSGLGGIGVLSVLGVLHQGGVSIKVDEVRVGTNYASVVGANLNPTIPTTLALAVAPAAKVSWTANSTNYYQPQSSTDGVNWNNLGNLLYGNSVTSVFDPAPSPFYQVEEILPALSETIQDGGFEISDGGTGAFYWPSTGSQLPTMITSDFHSGAACMQLLVTNTTTAAQICDLQQNNVADGGPGISAGTSYNFSFWAKSLGRNPSGGYVQQYKLTWLNSSGAVVGAVGFNNFTVGTNTWSQVTTGPVVAPAGAVNVLIEIRIATGGILNDFGGVLVDDASLSASSPGGTINILPAMVQTGSVFTATVKTNGVAAPGASGNITFLTNGVVQSTGAVVSGIASGTPALMPANYTVTANYLGDATYISSSASLTVGSGVNTTPTNIVTSVSGNQLTISWPADHTGWTLQSQTNTLGAGLRGTWSDVAGSTATNRISIIVNPKNPAVFYRLKF
ncbi:MAG TPA: hypothetical protein VG347_06590 [Verrucomicrobiae bacterium]|nr:hypothetical protein [Verrucomicrobiae bacterium]